jgi:hypothetical protein
MSLTERLSYLLTADSTQAVLGFDKGAASAEALAVAEAKVAAAAAKLELAEAKAGQVQAKAAGDADLLAAANTRLAAANEKVAATRAAQGIAVAKQELAGAEKAAEGLATKGNAATQALAALGIDGAAGPLAAGAAVVGAGVVVLKTVDSYLKLTDAVRQYQAAAGGTAEEDSRMVADFKALGIPIDQASGAMFKFGNNVKTNKAAPEANGVVIARDAQGNVDLHKTLLNVADAYQHTTDASVRDQIARDALGRGAESLTPILKASTEELNAWADAAAARGEIVTQKDLADSRDLEIKTRELDQSLEALKLHLGKGLVPVEAGAVNLVDELVRAVEDLAHVTAVAGKEAEKAPGAKAFWEKGLKDALLLGPTLLGVVEKKSSADKKAAEDAAKLADETLRAASAFDIEATAIDKDTSTLEAFVSARNNELSAQAAVATAEKAVTDAKAEGARKAHDEAAANDELRKANESLTQAEHDLAVAKKEAPENRAKAANEEELAKLALASATDAVTVAQEKYGATSKEAQKAIAERQKAEFGLTDASQKRADLDAAGNRPQPVVDAEQRIADAKDAQARAAEAKTKADQEDPVADLAKAEQDRQRAVEGEALARLKMAPATRDFNTEFGTSLTIADALNSKTDDFLDKLLKAQTALAAMSPEAQVAAAQASAAGGIGIAGAGVPAYGNPAATPSHVTNVTNFNNTFHIPGGDAKETINEMVFAGRVRGF